MRQLDGRYSNFLHNRAEKWGLEVMPGRPLIQTEFHIDNPYQPKQAETLELLSHKASGSEIRLFMFNGQWGYSRGLHCNQMGTHHGNSIKFCDPYPSRDAAIAAAVEEVKDRLKNKTHPKCKELLKWALGLLQARLF